MKPYLSVIIPMFNEEKNLKRGVLEEIDQYLKKQNYVNEVIIADDGSTDKSLEMVTKFVHYHPRFKIRKNKHAGKPFAIKSGLEKAQGGIFLLADLDLSVPIMEM